MDKSTTPSSVARREAALELHHAAFDPLRQYMRENDWIRAELSAGLKLHDAANTAAEINALAANAGMDTTQTLSELKDAIRALIEFDGGRLATIFFYLSGPSEDLHRDARTTH